jgi:hypothetical protein
VLGMRDGAGAESQVMGAAVANHGRAGSLVMSLPTPMDKRAHGEGNR